MIAKTTAATNSKPKCQHNKPTQETTTQTNFATIKTTTCFQLEPFHSRHPSQLGQVKMCQKVLTQLNVLGKLGDRYSFKKKSDIQQENPISAINNVVETIMADENGPFAQDPIGNATDEDSLMELFDQFASMTSSMLNWLELDITIVISEVSLQGKSTTYQITIQNLITIALLGTGANKSVVLEKFFRLLPQTPQLLIVHTHNVTSASGANLGAVDQCHLTFRLENKQFTDRFIILHDLHRNIMLWLNL